MNLKTLSLQNFRNYTKAEFQFSPQTTIIVGPNAIGKSNLLEAIVLLGTGKSNRSEKEQQLVRFLALSGRIKGIVEDSGLDSEEKILEIAFVQQSNAFLQKKYLINGITKHRADFAGKLPAVLFTPTDLEIIIGHPAGRREFLNQVLEQTDQEYRQALTDYSKALRQRNALLEGVQKTRQRSPEIFQYWDEVLIRNGQLLTEKREGLIEFINLQGKRFFPFTITYDKSVISPERLLQYKDAEVGAGVTLVGPHRDDFFMETKHPISHNLENVKLFSSRGQQRLVVLELKFMQILFIEEATGQRPLLLLDDIFSELDNGHIKQVLDLVGNSQTIITTTHKEFLSDMTSKADMIELN